ncbi:unnamed protein product [Leptosia nina]|uniref:MADF domain-containing protein n=1 Tax=Leptosia nina TaxID=320188 RepID=A0AAV1JD32_9NEOP
MKSCAADIQNSKMRDAIEVDHLITLVEQRSVLWDKTYKEYKNKNAKTTAWKEVGIVPCLERGIRRFTRCDIVS